MQARTVSCRTGLGGAIQGDNDQCQSLAMPLTDQACLPDCVCDSAMLGNGLCDADCNNAACEWDSGDCSTGLMLRPCSYAVLQVTHAMNQSTWLRF